MLRAVGSALRGVPGAALAAGLAIGCYGIAAAGEPLGFSPDAFAQPIAAAGVEPSGSVIHEPTPASGGALRWKAKQLGAMHAIATSHEQAPAPATARGWNKTRVDGHVRQVSGTAAAAYSDPFSDPFGDRAAAAAVGTGVRQASSDNIELEPTEAESNRPGATPTQGVEELPAPRPMRGVMSPRATPIDNSYIAQPPMPAPELTPPAPSTPEGAEAAGPCERIYNDRNCCDVEAGCKAFREQLIADSILNISLDITPRFMPDLTAEEDEANRLDKLRLLESRVWRGRRGEVLATGRMTNMRHGRVVISDDAGNEIASLPWSELGDDEICYINAWWRLPVECVLGGREVASRTWLASSWQWHASALCHKPLYFEEVQLERYGHTTGPFTQPWVSGAHFFLNVAVLPYHMAYQPPHECQYALGYYRPGSCAPWMIPPVPISFRGAAAEAMAIVGGVYLIP